MAEKTHPYEDIINLPHPRSSRHAPMSMVDRGAQFSPFAALVGYDAAIQETARLTDSPVELDESSKAVLDEKLRLLKDEAAAQPEVTVTWFRPDERKAGGAYVNTVGRVRKIDAYRCSIWMEDGTEIDFESIVGIEGEVFREKIE